jgi:nucleotide-binding universal stress UspA family protein
MNSTGKPVVVGIADKQPSAVRYAVDEARSTGAPLRVVHSAGLPAQAAEFYIGVNATMYECIRRTGQEVLDEARRCIDELAPRLDVTYVLTELAPLEALEQEASTARVLILGADDVPWLERLMRTRIAGYLAKSASCPVVVVPELELPTGPDAEIVITLDGDTLASGPLRFAFEEANARDGLLHVLHATPPQTLSSDAEASRANIAEVVAGWRETFPDVAVLEGSAVGDPVAAVARATRSAELVVVGRPHNHTIPLSLSRPLAMQVLAEAQCPVAIVPPDYAGA